MKIAAYILLITLGVYFAETIDIPLNACGSARAVMACVKMSGDACPMCHKKEQPKKAEHGCSNASVCADCPLCYNLLPVSYTEIGTVVLKHKTQYAEQTVNLITGYITARWKPPNAA